MRLSGMVRRLSGVLDAVNSPRGVMVPDSGNAGGWTATI
jgi:hypothetical protein